jgi:hypothetical protein
METNSGDLFSKSHPVGETFNGNFTKYIHRNCDEIKNMILTGEVSDAELVIGEEPNCVVINLIKTSTGAELFVYPEFAFPIHMTPFQQVRLVVIATKRVFVEYEESFISLNERNSSIQTSTKIKWAGQVYEFCNGVVQYGQEYIDDLKTLMDRPMADRHKQTFQLSSPSENFQPEIAWKIFSSFEPYIGREIVRAALLFFRPPGGEKYVDVIIRQTTHLEVITFEIQLSGEFWSGPIKYEMDSFEDKPLEPSGRCKNAKMRVFYQNNLIQTLNYSEWELMSNLQKLNAPKPTHKDE